MHDIMKIRVKSYSEEFQDSYITMVGNNKKYKGRKRIDHEHAVLTIFDKAHKKLGELEIDATSNITETVTNVFYKITINNSTQTIEFLFEHQHSPEGLSICKKIGYNFKELRWTIANPHKSSIQDLGIDLAVSNIWVNVNELVKQKKIHDEEQKKTHDEEIPINKQEMPINKQTMSGYLYKKPVSLSLNNKWKLRLITINFNRITWSDINDGREKGALDFYSVSINGDILTVKGTYVRDKKHATLTLSNPTPTNSYTDPANTDTDPTNTDTVPATLYEWWAFAADILCYPITGGRGDKSRKKIHKYKKSKKHKKLRKSKKHKKSRKSKKHKKSRKSRKSRKIEKR